MFETIYVGDTETTGVTPNDKLVEIAWFETNKQLNILDKFESLIDPQAPIHPAASAAHHLVADDLVDAPTVDELFEHILDGVEFKPALLVCHNVQFDKRYWPKEMNVKKYLCTLRAARKLYPDHEGGYSMQVLRYSFGLGKSSSVAHSALGDVEILYELLLKELKDAHMGITEFVEWVMRPVNVTKMPFGKHKGKRLNSLPLSYVSWLLNNTTGLDNDLKLSLERL